MLVLRHGQSEWNVQDRMQGRLDSPLTALGREQALRQGAILRRIGASDLPVYCSPQGRAIETARLAIPETAPVLDHRLSEIDLGDWQGLTLEEIARGWPDLFHHGASAEWKFRAPGGETAADLKARVEDFLGAIAGPAVIVTHGVTSQLIRSSLMGRGLSAGPSLEERQGVVYRIASRQQDILEFA